MKEGTTILPFRQSEKIDDPLTEIAREGARRMLAEALVAEADAFVAGFSEERLADVRPRIVRHRFGPERRIQTGGGAVEVRRPKVRDRISQQPETAKVRFTFSILPKWARRSASLDALLRSCFPDQRPSANKTTKGLGLVIQKIHLPASRRLPLTMPVRILHQYAAFVVKRVASGPIHRVRYHYKRGKLAEDQWGG